MSRMGIMGSLRGSFFSFEAVIKAPWVLDARPSPRTQAIRCALLGLYSDLVSRNSNSGPKTQRSHPLSDVTFEYTKANSMQGSIRPVLIGYGVSLAFASHVESGTAVVHALR